MPKKTKKEKLLASYHKKNRLLENKTTSVSEVLSPILPSKVISDEVKALPVNQYFFSDLKKSLLLITLIIGVEVGLYVVTR